METFVASEGSEENEVGRIPFCLRPSHKIPDEEYSKLEKFLAQKRRCNEEMGHEKDELPVIEYDKTRTVFIILVAVVIIISGLIITLLVFSMLSHEKEFNIHHVFMTFSSLILIPFSTLLYRLLPKVHIFTINFYHIGSMLLGIAALLVGFIHGILSHPIYSTTIADFQSPHSWIGLITMFLVICETASGLTFLRYDYCCDFTSPNPWYIRNHKIIGKATVISLFTSGITGYAGSIFLIERDENTEILILSSLGTLAFLLFLFFYNLLFDYKFRRRIRPIFEYIYLNNPSQETTISSRTMICKGELLEFARSQLKNETKAKVKEF